MHVPRGTFGVSVALACCTWYHANQRVLVRRADEWRSAAQDCSVPLVCTTGDSCVTSVDVAGPHPLLVPPRGMGNALDKDEQSLRGQLVIPPPSCFERAASPCLVAIACALRFVARSATA